MKRKIKDTDISPTLKYQVLNYLASISRDTELGTAPTTEQQIAEVFNMGIDANVVEAFEGTHDEITVLQKAVELGIATVCNLPPAGQKRAAAFAIKEARERFKHNAEAQEDSVDG